MEITLNRAQQKKLERLEKDSLAKVMGTLFDKVVVLHSGRIDKHGRSKGYSRLAILGEGGRLQGMGPEQIRKYRRQKENSWSSHAIS